MSVAATCPTDVLGLVFAAVQPPSARKRLPEVCRHWNAAFNSSAALWSDVRADFARLSQGLFDRDSKAIGPEAAAEFDNRMELLAAWLARRANLLRSLHIVWPSQDSGVTLASMLQQPMPRLSSLAIQCSDRSRGGVYRQANLRFADVACLARHQTQLISLTFGRTALEQTILHSTGLLDEPVVASRWLPHLPHLQRLQLPFFFAHQATLAAVGQLTGLMCLEVHVNSISAQRDLQCALRQLRGLTSLSTMLAEWPAPDDIAAEVDGAEQSCLSLAVGGLPQLAELCLSRGGVRELTAAPLTWLELSGTEFGMQDLCGCSRLVGLHCLLYTLIACLISNAEDDPDAEGHLPPGCLPALRLLRLRATDDDRYYFEGEPVWLPGELSAATSLTSLHVEGPEVTVRTLSEWWDQVEPPSPGQIPDSEDLENDALSEHAQWVPSVELPGPYFCLPRLRELSLLSCGLEAVPEFVAGLPKLHTLRLSGNDFRDSRHAAFFPRLPGPVCSTLRRLELRSCFLRAVPPALSHLTALTALDLSGNRTLEIERSDLEVFSRLTGLHELRLGKPPGLTQGKVEWSQASVAALLDVQRACAWLRLSDALQPPPQE